MARKKNHKAEETEEKAVAKAQKTDKKSKAPAAKPAPEVKEKMSRKEYEKELAKLQVELVKMQEWVKATGAKICVLFEGRDAAGKGGTIKGITEKVSPRVFRVVAMPSPTEREKSQMYIQRYLPHLPAGGEVVLFDRSWYNRAGVERVMGFTDEKLVEGFLKNAPSVERAIICLGHHPDQVLAGSEQGESGEALRGAHRRLREDLETQPDGPGEPPPLV